MPLVFLVWYSVQRSKASATSPQTRQKLSSANSPPPTRQRHLATANWPPQRPLSHFAQLMPAPSTWHSTKLKATFYLATTLATSIPPSDQRANHSATLTPRKFYLLNLRRFGWSTTFTVQMIRNLFSYITQPSSPHNQPKSKSNYSLITHISVVGHKKCSIISSFKYSTILLSWILLRDASNLRTWSQRSHFLFRLTWQLYSLSLL